MPRNLKPRYILSWRYSDGQREGVAEVIAEQVENLQDAVIKVKRRIAKQCSCFPVQIEITSATLPTCPPPRRLRTHRRGHPPLFEGPVEKNCIRLPKPLVEALRRVGGGSLSKGVALVTERYLEEFQPEEVTA